MLAARAGWTLAPAYDMNPNPQGDGLMLIITENDNCLDLNLALEVAASFHLDLPRCWRTRIPAVDVSPFAEALASFGICVLSVIYDRFDRRESCDKGP